MSATTLSNIQEIIERSIFESIRQEVVDKGYLPDITGAYPDDTQGWALWKTDIDTIVASKGFAIEIFNSGSSDAKGVKKVPRIVIESGSFLPGSLGGDPQRFYQANGDDYTSLVTPPQTVDFFINIHLISSTIAQQRVLHAILALSLPRRGYLTWYNDSTKSFFVRNINYYDMDNDNDLIIEKLYGYEIPDCWDSSDVIVSEGIARMAEITLNTNLQKYIDGSWGEDSDTMVIITSKIRGSSMGLSTLSATLTL